MIMSFPAGGPTDIVGRLIGQKLTEAWGQNVLIGGEVESMVGTVLAAAPQRRVGKLRAIAIAGTKRTLALGDVPTFAESGLPGYDASSWNGSSVPAGTPRAIVEKLTTEIVKIM